MVVADAGPLIAFVRIGRFDLLREVVGEVIVPGAVYEELVTSGRGKAGADEIARCSWIRRHTVENPAGLSLPSTLHRGEREAIVLAHDLRIQLLIDEQRGRRAAQAHDVDVIGTLAVIAEAKRRNLIDHARPLLALMITSGYWMEVDLVMAFLTDVGERED